MATLSTSFETFANGTTEVILGDSPNTVTFTGGEAAFRAAPSLYQTGSQAWLVDAGNTGTIDFETPIDQVSLFFKEQSDSAASVLTALDSEGNVIETVEGISEDWQEFSFNRVEGQPQIASIEIENNAEADATVAVDDFSTTMEGTEALDDPIPETIPQSDLEIELEPIATGLTAPNSGTSAPGIDNYLFVSDQTGVVQSVNLNSGEQSVFLDVRDQLVDLGVSGEGTFDERGLLGIAFHPEFADNGLFYTYTSEPVEGEADFSTLPEGEPADHQSVVTQWQVSDPSDPQASVDLNSAQEIMRIDQPQFNHNGGDLQFGPNGYLHISLGDGGSADDQGVGHSPEGNGQDASNVLGSILRIDPLGNNSANGQYGIPESNPFTEDENIADEIFAFGFRNPFRFSFDRETDDLIVGDVGQNDIEEINRVEAGENFGWPLKEGSFFFDNNGEGPGFVTDVDLGVPNDLVDPVLQYDHDEGISVINGFVYRGNDNPELEGQLVFGDFSESFDLANPQGQLFLGDLENGEIEEITPDNFPYFVLGFAEASDGEILVLANETGVPSGDTGTIFRLETAEAEEEPAVVSPTFGTLEADQLEQGIDFEGDNNLIFTGEENDLAETSTGGNGNRIYGGSGDDELIAGENSRLFGGTGNDILEASVGTGNNRLYGGAGEDDIIGGYKDRLIAGDGSDRLFLSAGEFQGGGDNLATGGAGADQFWLANAQFAGTVNTITDFTVGEDILGIAGVGLTFADLSIAASEENANNTVIATADQDLAILLGIQPDTISETDFTFSESAV